MILKCITYSHPNFKRTFKLCIVNEMKIKWKNNTRNFQFFLSIKIHTHTHILGGGNPRNQKLKILIHLFIEKIQNPIKKKKKKKKSQNFIKKVIDIPSRKKSFPLMDFVFTYQKTYNFVIYKNYIFHILFINFFFFFLAHIKFNKKQSKMIKSLELK